MPVPALRELRTVSRIVHSQLARGICSPSLEAGTLWSYGVGGGAGAGSLQGTRRLRIGKGKLLSFLPGESPALNVMTLKRKETPEIPLFVLGTWEMLG